MMKKLSTKIGLTDRNIFGFMLKDWIAYVAWHGARLVASRPHPDVEKEYSACSLHIEFTDQTDVKLDPLVQDAVFAASDIVRAIGWDQIKSVEKLPVEEDEEAKYVITIKKWKG